MNADAPRPQVRVFMATSLDGFIAGKGDDLSWLPDPVDANDDHGYAAHMATIGCLLFGRRTYDVVLGFGSWPYGEMPMVVATSRPLDPPVPTVQAASGDIASLIGKARELAAGKDIYLDGGNLIRQALDAGLVDQMTLTLIPTILGEGIPLFAGCAKRHRLQLQSSRSLPGNLVQLVFRPE